MSDNVVPWRGVTKADIAPETVLNGAIKDDLEMVFVLGWTKDGHLYMAASSGSIPEGLMMLELAKNELLSDG